MKAPVFGVCWKAVTLRATVDPLTGEVSAPPHSKGVSAADEAALELAMQAAEHFGGTVRLVSAGSDGSESVLRSAAAFGLGELVHVEMSEDAPSEEAARCLAAQLGDALLVWCGDMSADRGSGAVPAFLAARLGASQALGLLAVDWPEAERPDGEVSIEATRRLDGGRRERLRVTAPAVVSCEGAAARLRRAPLPGVLSARSAPLKRQGSPGTAERPTGWQPRTVALEPFRPPARVVPPPVGASPRERIGELVGVGAEPATARAVTLEPLAAADAILEALRSWGELP